MTREIISIDTTQLDAFRIAVESGYRPDTAAPSHDGRMLFSRPEWCDGQNRAVADLSRDQRREHSRGACCPAEAPTRHAGMRELVQHTLDLIRDLPLTNVITHDWQWESERAEALKDEGVEQHPDIADAVALERAHRGTPEAIKEHLLRMEFATDEPWMRLARFAAEACRLILSSEISTDPDGRRPDQLKALQAVALGYFAHLAGPRLDLERTAYRLHRIELNDRMAKVIEKLDRTDSDQIGAAVRALQPLCAAYLTLTEPPQATQWALDLAWRVGATEYDAELVPLSEQVNGDTLRAEIERRLPEAADYDLTADDLDAALATVGAVDHDDTATRYCATLRVSEAAQPRRERLRQQVAKFSA
jgi:hypothetical protein